MCCIYALNYIFAVLKCLVTNLFIAISFLHHQIFFLIGTFHTNEHVLLSTHCVCPIDKFVVHANKRLLINYAIV